MTIALMVGLALVARGAEAAEPEAASAAPAEGAAASDGSGDAEAGRGGRAPTRGVGNLPDKPFEDDSDDVSGAGEGESDDDEAPGAPLRALACLEGEGGNDKDGARRGVQKRDFLKRHRFEIAALGGHLASDALSSTYVYGGALSFFLSEDFGLEAMVLRNPVSFRLENAYMSFDGQQHFQPGSAWNLLGAMTWSPVHAKLRFSDKHITHADLMLSAGAGQTLSGIAQGLTWQAGLGLKLFLFKYLTLRIDLRDLIVPQEVLGHGRITHNIATMLGLCGWIPG